MLKFLSISMIDYERNIKLRYDYKEINKFILKTKKSIDQPCE